MAYKRPKIPFHPKTHYTQKIQFHFTFLPYPSFFEWDFRINVKCILANLALSDYHKTELVIRIFNSPTNGLSSLACRVLLHRDLFIIIYLLFIYLYRYKLHQKPLPKPWFFSQQPLLHRLQQAIKINQLLFGSIRAFCCKPINTNVFHIEKSY